MSPRVVKKNRVIRVQSPLWEQALAVADMRGESLSEVIRAALVRYVAKYGKDLES